MKIQLQTEKNQGVGLLIFICLGAAFVIGIALASYLMLVQGENATVFRSQDWNSSMAMTEAGIEEGMALVNKYASTGTTLTSWPGTATADGWTQSGNVYHLTRHLGEGYYSVYVTNVSSTAASIKSTGTVLWTNLTVTTLSRAVVVNVGASSAFQGGILSKFGITLSGGALVDSFNSSDPRYSSNGLYVLSRHNSNGNIMTDASNAVLMTDITFSGNINVYGHVTMGPNDGLTYSGNATVGDTNFAGPGIEGGWTNSTANILIPDAPPMPVASWLPMPTKVSGAYTLNGGGLTNYYQIPSSFGNLSGSDKIVVTNGTIILDIEGGFQMSGSSSLVLAPNANVVAWLNGANPQLSGQGIVNQSGNATNVTIYGTTNMTSLQMSGGSAFIGTIYAPYADVQLSGGSALIGSIVARSFQDSGGNAIHYDENLHGQQSGSYVVTSWSEVPP